MYGCESWTMKKAERWRIDALELCCWRRLLSPLDCKEIQPVHPKGNKSWIFIGRTDAEAETPVLWPPDAKNWLIRKDPDAGKDWRWEEKGTTEDEMVGWHHWLDGHEFEQAPGVGDGQVGLACCSPWGCKELDTTEWLNWLKFSWRLSRRSGLCDLHSSPSPTPAGLSEELGEILATDSSSSVTTAVTVIPSHLWVSHPCIQPPIGWKYLETKFQKVPNRKTWICHVLATIYTVLTLY